ncbi:hypothetical protein HK405_000781, partial [Cladochytrium tenue]
NSAAPQPPAAVDIAQLPSYPSAGGLPATFLPSLYPFLSQAAATAAAGASLQPWPQLSSYYPPYDPPDTLTANAHNAATSAAAAASPQWSTAANAPRVRLANLPFTSLKPALVLDSPDGNSTTFMLDPAAQLNPPDPLAASAAAAAAQYQQLQQLQQQVQMHQLMPFLAASALQSQTQPQPPTQPLDADNAAPPKPQPQPSRAAGTDRLRSAHRAAAGTTAPPPVRAGPAPGKRVVGPGTKLAGVRKPPPEQPLRKLGALRRGG